MGGARKISWTEPWCWRDAKDAMRKMAKEYPPWWRMLVYCVILPAAVFVGAVVLCPEILLPENQELLAKGDMNYWQLMAYSIGSCCILFWGLPFVVAVCPESVQLRIRGMTFQQGNATTIILMKQVVSISFRTSGESRLFVVEAKNRKGKAFVKTAKLSPKVTEAEIIGFLCDNGFAHLYKAAP